MEKSDAVIFTSSNFEIEPGEDKETNPGIYGRAVARWIAEQLGKSGTETREIIAEDWGWCVIVKSKKARLGIAVSNVDGSSIRWQVFAFAERGLLNFFRGSSVLEREVSILRGRLEGIISALPGVSDVSRQPLE